MTLRHPALYVKLNLQSTAFLSKWLPSHFVDKLQSTLQKSWQLCLCFFCSRTFEQLRNQTLQKRTTNEQKGFSCAQTDGGTTLIFQSEKFVRLTTETNQG